MKMFLPFIMLLLSAGLCRAQQESGTQNFFTDTTSYTQVESAMRQKGVAQKVEYISSRNIGGIYFGLIIVRNLQTQEVTKGAYIAAESPIRPTLTGPRWDREAFIDESEFDAIIQYLDNCSNVWKKDATTSATSYEFETKDRFRFRFAANDDSRTWRFTLEFRNYYFFNKDNLARGRTEEIYDAFKLFKEIIKRY